MRITFSFKGLTFLRISGILFVLKVRDTTQETKKMNDTTTTTYTATYHNNYPTCNGRQVFDKEGKITLTNGRLNLTFKIVKWHSFDDYGAEMETVTLQNVMPFCNEVEAYSYDGGETFTFDCE